MVTVDYSPWGAVIRDSFAIQFAEEVKAAIDRNEEADFKSGNAVAISAVRAFVAEGKIDSTKIQITFSGEPLSMDQDARIKDWPKGFCDTEYELLLRIITANSGKEHK